MNIQNLDLQQPGIWFPLVTGAIALLFILFMPKRQMNWRGIYITFGVIGYVTLMLDVFIVGEYFDLFDIGSQDPEGIGDLMTYAVIPSCLAVAYLNFFDRKNIWLYVALFTAISFLFEWELTHVGYMKLKGWQNWYSIPVYIIVYYLWLPWHLKLIQQTHDEKPEKNYAGDRIEGSGVNINKTNAPLSIPFIRKKIK